MKAIQNLNNFFQKHFFLTVSIIVLLSFLLFIPKLASRLFPFKREAMLNQFIATAKMDQPINPQKYWEFREFYSPGYFTFDRTGIKQDLKNQVLGAAKVTITDHMALPFLRYTSPYLNSVDYLTTRSVLSGTVSVIMPHQTLFQNANHLLYQVDKNHLVSVFVLPVSEMEKANGFFDYGEKDKKLVAGKYWLNVTILQQN